MIPPGAVSYTHLDVYKRQVLNRSLLAELALKSGEKIGHLLHLERLQQITPVSYTHLDVYKRQA